MSFDTHSRTTTNIVCCVHLLFMQALWQLLWVNPTTPNTVKSVTNNNTLKGHTVEVLQHRVSVVAAELLSQVNMNFDLFSIYYVCDYFYSME